MILSDWAALNKLCFKCRGSLYKESFLKKIFITWQLTEKHDRVDFELSHAAREQIDIAWYIVLYYWPK